MVFTANRLQRRAIKLSAYSYDIKYRETSKHGNVDALSRLPLKDQHFSSNEEQEVVELLKSSIEGLPLSANQIRQATAKDPLLGKIKCYIQTSWPTDISNPELKAFAAHQDMLSEQFGCLFFGSRLAIPAECQEAILNELHVGHLGIVKMKSLAREYVFRPNIDKFIESRAKACIACAENDRSLAKAPLLQWEPPQRPFQRSHIDFAGPFLNTNWLIVIDAYSRWPEVVETKSMTTAQTISQLRQIFARFGLPEILVSDNGPQLDDIGW